MKRLTVLLAALFSFSAFAQTNNFNVLDKAFYPTTFGTSGQCWMSGGSGVAPNWGSCLGGSGTLSPTAGGTGVANNAANTLTFTGNFSLGVTLSGNTAVTLPTSGTVCASGNACSGTTITATTKFATDGEYAAATNGSPTVIVGGTDASAGNVVFYTGSTQRMLISGANTVQGVSQVFGWGSGAPDVAFSRTAAGVVAVGTGAAASTAGSLIAGTGVKIEGATNGIQFQSGYGLGFAAGASFSTMDTSLWRSGVGELSVGAGASSGAAGSLKAARYTVGAQTLTDQATVTWDTSAGAVGTVTIAASRTMAAPTNLTVGTYILHVIQGGAGSFLMTWNAIFKWPSGIAPTLSTTVGARDVISCVSDATNLYCAFLGDVK